MTPLQDAVWRLRSLCKDAGIYTLSSLDCFVHAGAGGTQEQIATNSHQSKSAAGIFLNMNEIHGLIALERKPNEKRKPISYTEDGQKLIAQLTKLLCP